MKRVFNKWERLNLKYKLFTITSSLLVVLAVIIYLILYLLLPSYYHKYKISMLDNSLKAIAISSNKYDTETLKEIIYYMAKDQNLAVVLKNQNGDIIYGNNEVILLKFSKFIINRPKEEHRETIKLKANDSKTPYTLEVVMTLQPVDEASDVISKLMPYIILIALLIGMIGAYIYSNVITKPLIEVIESEREAENRRKDFVATISHELKTPITIISGQLEGMIYNIGKYKDRDTYLQKSYDSVQELKDLVNEMMEVSKSEILITELKLNKVNFSELLNKLVHRQMFLIEEKYLNVDLQIQENISVKCDEEKVTRAINNIINNAIKYSPQGENIIVRLYKKNTKHKVCLEIENTGITIDKQYLNQIFEPFFRIEKSRSRKTGGSGLGLYIVSQIFKSHG
ncbi:MAG: two-component sensor histidine kinase, partial [Romboutsia sp.]|nr:two-component sensor histidine kinase [Romboutsia sp.]